ncbi:murein DD-endopeptidase MepM/ murein hydrolase activator NlpD [Gellertiella hungarica]|uniref:Murein DD-endopeptidase MepM/ murein hydrolase activator NlpD n=2 Tax=Gellertiella hungarica TaxID=1572859 RepID=A0A7W6J562_9HYPH|nr:murein DD-endopeptidase MepM/ murein hydrolase activator NlpD [Gellertiella hungarica]
MTTNSIPHRNITGLAGDAPIPQQDIGGYGAQTANAGVYQQPANAAATRTAALNQPFPGKPYDGVTTGTTSVSQARLASTPVAVERSTLSAPGSAAGKVALAQPMPAKIPSAPKLAELPSKSGWSANGAPSVTLRPGETIAGLSRRYGVPEKEILRVNGLASAGQVTVGQQIIIPTFGRAPNAAKGSAQVADLPTGKLPMPAKEPTNEVATLPSGGTLRNKQLADGTKLPQPAAGGGEGGTYTVKPGDSLAKIARVTGTHIDELKAANGLTASAIRVGQVLKLPGKGGAPAEAADSVKTASISAKEAAAPAATAAIAKPAAQPEAYKPPVAKETVTEAAAKADDTEAPDQTGIGKYRWPVRGAVIAGYGSNVEGNRNDGIDISVPAGTPIKAAENGVVIYAGNGLKELGNTVLVRHDDGTVTVYGNADSLNVTRGQKVQRGQTLASSGMSGNAKRPQVHFEVRKDATPVNPMTYLN